MRTIYILSTVLTVLFYNPDILAQADTDANVFGHVVSAEDGEHIPFINIIIESSRTGTITDASGHYILTNIPAGRHTLTVKGMGYETKSTEFEITENQTIEIDFEVEYMGIDLEEIVITSSPTASGFRYRPDMTYTGESLQRRSEVSFGEMLNGEPGVAMRSFGSSPARPVIRGMDGDRILVLENGERMGDISGTSADHTIALDPLAAQRIEVVRGPASLLYGSSALGGVINLMTTDIPDRWDPGSSGVLSLQGASVNRMGAGFGRYTYGSEELAVSGRLAHRQSADIRTPDGILQGTSMSNFDASAGIGFDTGRSSGGTSFSMADQVYEIPDNVDNPDEGVEIRMQRQALQGRINFRNEGFMDRGQFRFNASRMFQEEIEYEWEGGDRDEEVALDYEKYALSSTLTMQHKPFEFFDRGAIGVNLHAHKLDVGGGEAYTPGEQRFNLGIFTFQEIPLSNTMRMQAGLRFDFQNTGALANELFPGITAKRNAFNYTGSIGFNHRPVDGLEVGGQFARSHRNPSVEELYARGTHLGAGVYETGNRDLKDEIGQGVDFFINWNGGSVEIELAAFVNYFRNYIIFAPIGEVDPDSGYPVFSYTGDAAQLTGGEFSARFMLHDNLDLGLGADFVDGRRVNNGNHYLPFIPPFRLMASFEYDFGSGWIGGKILSAAKQDKVAPDEAVTEGYTLLGMSAGYRFTGRERHVIILRADNLLDERYRDHLSRVEDRNYPMPGRNITLAYRLFF
ncbi:MAG: TonB-dependent receptor [Bacteroidales bacterium]